MAQNEATKDYTKHLGLIVSIIGFIYWFAVERTNLSNNIDIVATKIESVKSDVIKIDERVVKLNEKKVDYFVFNMIIEDLKEIKADLKAIRKGD